MLQLIGGFLGLAMVVGGQLYHHEERQLPVLGPDAVLVVLVVVGALALVSLLS